MTSKSIFEKASHLPRKGRQMGAAMMRFTKSALQPGSKGTKSQQRLDTLQGFIDLLGMADPFGLADLLNAQISLARAYNEKSRRKEHLLNATASAVSAAPYVGDSAKIVTAKRDARALKVAGEVGEKAAAKAPGLAARSSAAIAARGRAITAAIARRSRQVRASIAKHTPAILKRTAKLVREHPGEAIAITEAVVRTGLALMDTSQKKWPRVKQAWGEVVSGVGRVLARPSAWEATSEAITRGLETYVPDDQPVDDAEEMPAPLAPLPPPPAQPPRQPAPAPPPPPQPQFAVRQRQALQATARRTRTARGQRRGQRGLSAPQPDLSMISQVRASLDAAPRRRGRPSPPAGNPSYRGGVDVPPPPQVDTYDISDFADRPPDERREVSAREQPTPSQAVRRKLRRAVAENTPHWLQSVGRFTARVVSGVARSTAGMVREVAAPAIGAATGAFAGTVVAGRFAGRQAQRGASYGLSTLGEMRRMAFSAAFLPPPIGIPRAMGSAWRITRPARRAAVGGAVAATGLTAAFVLLTKTVRSTNAAMLAQVVLLAQYHGHLAQTLALQELNATQRRRWLASQTGGSFGALAGAQSVLAAQTAKYQAAAINFFNRSAAFYTKSLSFGIYLIEIATGIDKVVGGFNWIMGQVNKNTPIPHQQLMKDLADGTILKNRMKRKNP